MNLIYTVRKMHCFYKLNDYTICSISYLFVIQLNSQPINKNKKLITSNKKNYCQPCVVCLVFPALMFPYLVCFLSLLSVIISEFVPRCV